MSQPPWGNLKEVFSMRNIEKEDLQVGLNTNKFICVSVREAYKYENGKPTQVQEGYYVDALSPDLPGVILTVKVKKTQNLKVYKPVHFGGLEVKLYAPKEWDIRVSMRADVATSSEKEGDAA